jgi:Protein of unknown function (DUF2442)
MAFLPLVVRAEHRGGYRVHLVFNDDVEATVDCEQWLRGPVFEPLKNRRYFSRLFIDGGTVVWPNGADIAPETLYKAAVAEVSADRRARPAAAVARESRAGYKPRQKRKRR